MERLILFPNDGRDARLRGFYTEQGAIKLLAAYGDFDEEGRLAVLACKVGDPVWFVVRDVDDPGRWEICEPQKITEVGTRGFWISGLLDEPDGMHMFTPWSALGTDAFLSREAAEAALKERENDG